MFGWSLLKKSEKLSAGKRFGLPYPSKISHLFLLFQCRPEIRIKRLIKWKG